MNFKTAIVTGYWKKYWCFSGRASRSEHNYFYLFMFILSIITAFLDPLVFNLLMKVAPTITLDVYAMLQGSPILAFLFPLSLVVMLVVTPPAFSITIRRLHDINMSGWYIVPYWMISIPFYFDFPNIIIASVSLIVILIAFILLCCKKGSTGENKYGPVPE